MRSVNATARRSRMKMFKYNWCRRRVGKLSQSDAKRVLIHSVCADDAMCGLGAASKLNADVGFLRQLRALGRERAQAWIDDHFDDLGSRSTVDIQAAYL